MTTRNLLMTLGLLAGCLLQPLPGFADEVVMKNGDRITGSIVSKDDQVLVISTEYAGELKIVWANVVRLQSEKPVWVYLQDGTRMQGRLVTAPDGGVAVEAGDALKTGTIPVADVRWINPPAELSGEGVKMSGYANVGYASSAGNTDTEKWYLDAEAVARTRDNRYTLGGQSRRAEDAGVQTESNWLGYMKYDHFLSKRWYGYGNGNFEHDQFKDIRLRTTLGLGSGYQFFETERLNLSLEGGLSYVNTDFELQEDENYPAARMAVKYDQYLFSTSIQFFHNDEVYMDVEDTSNVFLRSQTGFRFPLVSRLNATLQYDYDWDNDPSPGRVKADKTLRATLGYAW